MKKIELKPGVYTKMDDESYELIKDKKLYYFSGKWGNPYCTVVIRVDGKRKVIPLHRIITSCPKHMIVDHINGNGLDNRLENLRVCTKAQNMSNQKIHKNNKSGYKGVVRLKENTWEAKINSNKVRIHLGKFSSPQDAAMAYDKAARIYHGEFAITNF